MLSSNRVKWIQKRVFRTVHCNNISENIFQPFFNVLSPLWARSLIFRPKRKEQKYRSQLKNHLILFRAWICAGKTYRPSYYERRVQLLKESSPLEGWKETERLSRITNSSQAKETCSMTSIALSFSDLSPPRQQACQVAPICVAPKQECVAPLSKLRRRQLLT